MTLLTGLMALVPSTLALLALVGLAAARQAEPLAAAVSALVLVFLPAGTAWLGPSDQRPARTVVTQLVWATALWAALPIYFPGERRESVATGLAVLTRADPDSTLARDLADRLPDEPAVASSRPALAEVVVPAPAPPPTGTLGDHQIVLPYEGEGNRLSVPVVFEHDGVEFETFMLLDTGATYTTLSRELLARLGALPGPGAPELVLSTANGPRNASVTLVDRVWLGDLGVDGVAITECDDCADRDHAGLLGLNVTGGYNLTIDADRREVVFTTRGRHDRRLDVKPFANLDGRFTRFPGGRVEFELDLVNDAPRTITEAVARIDCGEVSWRVELGPIASGASDTVSRRLPPHPTCDSYRLELDRARW